MTAPDWRLTSQDKYLQNAVLVKSRYIAYSAAWDHDHCEFCWAKFSLRDGDLHEGYCTPDRYRWVCPTCYEDFKERFHFIIETSTP